VLDRVLARLLTSAPAFLVAGVLDLLAFSLGSLRARVTRPTGERVSDARGGAGV
jgi:hypothetical protein